MGELGVGEHMGGGLGEYTGELGVGEYMGGGLGECTGGGLVEYM